MFLIRYSTGNTQSDKYDAEGDRMSFCFILQMCLKTRLSAVQELKQTKENVLSNKLLYSVVLNG